MKFIRLACLFLFFTSCKESKKPNPIVGTWEYDKIEQHNGQDIDLTDSAYLKLHRQHFGLTFSFSKNYVFKVTQKKADNSEEFIAEQKYELPEDKKVLRLINTGRPNDEFPIINLSDSFLRIDVFKSPVGYIVFRKK